MYRSKLWFFALVLASLIMTGAVAAQDIVGTLTVNQPVVVALEGAGAPARLGYSLAQDSAVVIQALAEVAQPTLTLLRNGVSVASQPNESASLIITLSTYLTAGDYIVEVDTVSAGGTVIVVLQSESPLQPVGLPVGVAIGGEVTEASPLALYTFDALLEPAYLYIDSGLPDAGVRARLSDETQGRISAVVDASLLGARLRIPSSVASYQLEIGYTPGAGVQPFTLCYTPVSAGGCEGALPPVEAVAPPVEGCVATPVFSGGANIRQSATQSSPILIVLPGGAQATILGISPDGAWYNVVYNGVNGWVALSAATGSGNCAGLPVINPPAVAATQPPPPPPPTDVPAPPPPPPTPMPTPTPSGPCRIVIVSPTFVYVQPIEDISYLFDQVAMGELIPIGRYQSGGQDWWKTNYGNSWYLNAPTSGGYFDGDCSGIPFITP
ncbi:MAG: SH3 domain-containing protein [Aggregatilineales bacterium]